MRTLVAVAAASILALAPRLASAQEAGSISPQPAPADDPAPVVITPPAAGATVIILPPQPPAYAPAPVYAPPAYAPYAAPPVWQPTPTADPPAMRRRNKGLMIGGLVMIPLGLSMAIGGGVWAHDIAGKPSACDPTPSDLGEAIGSVGCGIAEGLDRGISSSLAYTMVIFGSGMTIAGTVMAITGAQMVPARPRFRPAVRVGAGNATLTWTF